MTETVLAQGPSEKMGRAQRALGIARDSADTQEGMLAFREKRKPAFTGR